MNNKLIILLLLCLSTGLSSFSQTGVHGDQDVQISIYPNPAVEFLIVQIEGGISKAKFELNSMIGNELLIRSEEIGVGRYKIPVKNLATGYYFLVIEDEEKRFKKAFKFLKH